jgi:hypothetical protein
MEEPLDTPSTEGHTGHDGILAPAFRHKSVLHASDTCPHYYAVDASFVLPFISGGKG